MTDQSTSPQMRRGLHRVGIALTVGIGLCAMAVGVTMSVRIVSDQQTRFLALQCLADNDLHAGSDSTSEQSVAKGVCGLSLSGLSAEEIAATQKGGFNYTATLASYLGVATLVAGLMGLITYFSVVAAGWVARKFRSAPWRA